MNPQNGNELPPIQYGEQGTPLSQERPMPSHEVLNETARAQAIEQGRIAPMPQVAPPQPVPTTAPQPVPLPPTAVTAMPLMADDIDLIEKEWVEKAKAIVEQTKLDPRMQSREIGRVKADYIKRRFNKDVKLEEE